MFKIYEETSKLCRLRKGCLRRVIDVKKQLDWKDSDESPGQEPCCLRHQLSIVDLTATSSSSLALLSSSFKNLRFQTTHFYSRDGRQSFLSFHVRYSVTYFGICLSSPDRLTIDKPRPSIMPRLGSTTTHHCFKKNKGNCRYNKSKGYCTTHQTLCTIHNTVCLEKGNSVIPVKGADSVHCSLLYLF